MGHEGEVSQGHQHGENVKRLKTNLTEMTIVDRNLKPHYILESAPRLSRLTVDWQQVIDYLKLFIEVLITIMPSMTLNLTLKIDVYALPWFMVHL